MLSLTQSRLLLCVFALALVHASWLDGLSNLLPQHAERAIAAAKQSSSDVLQLPNLPQETATDNSNGNAKSTASPTSPPPKTTSDSPPPSSTPASTPPPTKSTAPPASSDSSSSPSSPSSQDTASAPQTTEPPKSTPDPTSSQSVNIVTQVSTVDGSVTTISSTNTNVTPSPTNTASLANTGKKASGGMDTKTKNTVIGVVVGVGGAIILAGLGAVAWRIWGRKKKDDDNDDLMGYRASSAGAEKTGPGGAAANPFQSTLESYHNPTKNLNASSNF